MAEPRWKLLEDQARGIASLVFGKPCARAQISGINFDGVIELSPLETVVLEISQDFDVDKVRQGVGRIGSARLVQAANGVVLRGYIVLSREPTPAMLAIADDNKVAVLSVSQLAAMFFEFPRYRDARLKAAFGSSIDPLTGKIDDTDYVPVAYTNLSTGADIDVAGVANALLAGKNIVLLGEYGSGKSRCIRQIFSKLANDWDINFRFPFAVNIRECWGLDQGDEIVRRAVRVLGLDDLQGRAVRTLNSQSLILLLDGFDEIGSQAWGTDEARLRQLRARALAGVRDAISKSGAGCLVAGREHYFSTNEEMFAALGMNPSAVMVIRAKDEFTEDELELYFERANLWVELPGWLPRRPLICQTIALLSDEELASMFGIQGNEATFWNHFINVLCQRDARINTFFDAETIYRVFVSLSRITRKRASNVGPISQRDLQDAFEAVVGQLPGEEAAVMLLRLPSLGRVGPETTDRQFVDMFILDGLRAKDVAHIADLAQAPRRAALDDNWSNPLSPLGQAVLSLDIGKRVTSFVSLANEAARENNATLSADIISSLCLLAGDEIDCWNILINGGAFSELNLSALNIRNVTIDESTIETLILPDAPPRHVVIRASLAGKVTGAASFAGLPSWVQLESVDRFDSVQTVAQIRRAGLSPAHEVLVAILKKTFLQKGAGRKEEALFRGFGAGSIRRIAVDVVSLLMRERFLDRHKGNEGWVYTPARAQGDRVKRLLAQLRSTEDKLWAAADKLNKH
jgi:hypothetical protein